MSAYLVLRGIMSKKNCVHLALFNYAGAQQSLYRDEDQRTAKGLRLEVHGKVFFPYALRLAPWAIFFDHRSPPNQIRFKIENVIFMKHVFAEQES